MRRDVVSDGAEFSPSFVAGDILEADAQLISAAPELLEALKKAVMDRTGCHPEPYWLPEARAAIARATGGEK